MKKFLIRVSIFLTIAVFVGALSFLLTTLFFSKHAVAVDKPTMDQQAIINTKFGEFDEVNADELDTPEKIYNTLHEMVNTKIVAENGLIWGLKPMTKDRIEAVQKAVKALGIKDDKINEMLKKWHKQDFSDCVNEHNYIWENYLKGSIGKAVALRK